MNIDATAFRDSLIPAFFLEDFYKFGHVHQYPKNITQVWLNCTPRYSLRPDPKPDSVVLLGTQRLILEVLVKVFNETFFNVSLKAILADYRTLFGAAASTDHIERLWSYGRLPVDLYALPEGSSVPYGVPAIVMTNTQPWAYWVPNFLETLCSAELWGTCVSATTARQFRRLFTKKYFDWCVKRPAIPSSPKDREYIQFQGHDFSLRGMFGIAGGTLSGLGHLALFKGTDSVPALFAARRWYGEPLPQGAYVPATEHSVMSAGSKDGEFETFERLLFETYPDAPFLSIVSDTWDLWKVCTDYLPRLKDRIMARPGILVIRPDSGDPVKIICGDKEAVTDRKTNTHERYHGVATLLANVFGTDAAGLINKVRIIYGDGINLDRAERILDGLIAKGLSPANVVLGLGSFTYQYVTRDTDGWAWKATAVRLIDGTIVPIFKDPVTDDGGKRSCRGIPIVYRGGSQEEGVCESEAFYLQPSVRPEHLDFCAFQKLFADGRFDESKCVTLTEIRTRTEEN